jgi:hypothetical protein
VAATLSDISPYGLERRVDTCQGTVTIDGFLMHRLAIELYDLSALHKSPDQRGRSRILPGNPGTVAYAPRVTETRFSLPLLVCGGWNLADGYVDPEDRWEQLELNMDALMTDILLPTGTGGGTQTLVWTRPSGATVTSQVQVLPLPEPKGGGEAAVYFTTLEILAPDGDLHL